MKLRLLCSVALAGLSISGCSSNSPTPAYAASQRIVTPNQSVVVSNDGESFDTVMQKLVTRIKANPDYHKIGLKTPEEKRWFKKRLYRLWHRDITRRDFIEQGVKRYPNKRYEFAFLADAMQSI